MIIMVMLTVADFRLPEDVVVHAVPVDQQQDSAVVVPWQGEPARPDEAIGQLRLGRDGGRHDERDGDRGREGADGNVHCAWPTPAVWS